MERHEILRAKDEVKKYSTLHEIKNNLEKKYFISYGKYENYELKKAIDEKKPVVIDNNFLIGYDSDEIFINDTNESIRIEKMVKALIIEDVRSEPLEDFDALTSQQSSTARDPFAIIGKNEWNEPNEPSDVESFLSGLSVGEIFLPPHSAIFNFFEPTSEQKKDKVVSMLDGININIYQRDNAIDNIIHEIGHLFWRDCVKPAEKKAFQALFNTLKPSAIYNFEWERGDAEEVFCTIYKWYVKSILINRSFFNILEFEEPRGLELLESVMDRIRQDRVTEDVWDLSKKDVSDYLNPVFDKTTGKFMRKAGLFDRVKDISIPSKLLNNIEVYRDGIEYVRLDKAVVPVKGNKIDFDKMHKAKSESDKPVIFLDLDGVVADFAKGYKDAFNRNAYEDDSFTVTQFCMQSPNFFRFLPVIDKGKELVDILKDDYKIVFLTTPMDQLAECRRDKIEWVKDNFGQGFDIIFSHNKADYAEDEKSILIDDMGYNLKPWADAGGTAIDFNKNRIDAIIDKIEEAIYGKKEVAGLTEKLKKIIVDPEPTEKQKEAGNYSKGEIVFKNIPIVIENVPGSIRFGFDEKGKKWTNRMKAYYGYIKKTEGADGDEIDCYIGPKLNASRAFVINQNLNGIFDEVKIVLGCDNIEEATDLYLSNYQKGWEQNIGSVVATNTKKLREWLAGRTRFEPYPDNN